MAFVSEFLFDNMTGINNDNCGLEQRAIQDNKYYAYISQNYGIQNSTLKDVKLLATSQPGLLYNGGHSISAGGENIDKSSELTIGGIQTHPRCKIDLFQRPFASVPYLGRGNVDKSLESQIQQGIMTPSRRSLTQEKHTYTPLLIPELKKDFAKSPHVSEVFSRRGGISSRDSYRDVA